MNVKKKILSLITEKRLSKMKQCLPLSCCFKLTIEPNIRDSYHFMQVNIEKKTQNIFDNIWSSFKQTFPNVITFY